MRGIAWYSGSYKRTTEERHEKYREVLRRADELCFKYFIKPCITLRRNGLLLEEDGTGSRRLTASLSNIGGMDSDPVTVVFYRDGEQIATRTAEVVPAGANRHETTALLTVDADTLGSLSGFHTFEACIIDAPGSTVLDAAITTERYLD
jgi:hypothetical protein